MKVLVCGGRKFKDKDKVYQVLNGMKGITEIIEGGAPGADHLANQWAAEKNIRCTTFFASWNTHGKAAGVIRNSDMLKNGQPDAVVAFPGGPGTADMVQKAKNAGLEVFEIV